MTTHPTAEPTPAAPATPFDWIGGEPAVHALVERFYDLMDLEPGYAALRATHGSTLADARQKLFWFLCGWLGGPDHYIERVGHPRLRMRHLPYANGPDQRDAWRLSMRQALDEEVPDPALRTRLREVFTQMADHMLNTLDRSGCAQGRCTDQTHPSQP